MDNSIGSKALASQATTEGINLCGEWLSGGHVEEMSKRMTRDLLSKFATIGQCLNGIIEGEEDVTNILERLSGASEKDDTDIEDTLMTLDGSKLSRLYTSNALLANCGIVGGMIADEIVHKQKVSQDELKLRVGKIIRLLARLCKEHNIKLIDCIVCVMLSIQKENPAD